MAAQPTDADITQIAAEYSIPPAILLGVVRSQGASPTFNMPSATLGAYNLSSGDVAQNPLLALTVAARTIAQSFAQTGSWEQALSTYLTGDPNAASSPTSSVGGDVASILGQAAVNASFGMQGYVPANVGTFRTGSGAFAQHMQGMVSAGGVVTQHTISGYQNVASQAWTGGNNVKASANMEQVAEDILNKAKLPVTDANVALITTMARGEGMPLGDFNWLATTSQAGRSVGTVNNTPGVKQYASYEDGIAATAQTFLNGHYDAMVDLMRQGADLKTIASNPGVQRDLRTWQGGSSEDVRLLTHENNVQGAKPTKDAPPNPAKVGEFAAQLQGAHINPREFAEHFEQLAAQRRRLLGSQRTDVSDYASMQTWLQSQGLNVDSAGIIAHLREQPHPTYPTVTVGQFHDTNDKAMLHSVMHTGQTPSEGEVARLVGLDNKELSTYFQTKAAQDVTQPQNQTQPGKVLPMPQQRETA